MADQRILLIDDDLTLLELLAEHLEAAGYLPLTANNGCDGLKYMESVAPDLVVLDVMMPGMDGWEVCRQLRTKLSIPVIMLTAKSEELDKLRGFRLGVDDYVTKPFSFAEMVARVGAVLSRTNRTATTRQEFTSGGVTIDLDNHRVTVNGRSIDLTPTEYRLLALLAGQAPRTVATEHLLDAVWGSEYAGEVKHVKHYIWSLRRKIEVDPGDPQHILTERGFGYRFE